MNARDPIEAASEALALTTAGLARLLGVAPERLERAMERGAGEDRDVLTALADVFGLELSELDDPALVQRPTTAMLRSFVDDGEGAFDEMVAQGLPAELGRFTRLVRRKVWLRRALGREPAPSALESRRVTIDADERSPFRAEHLATTVRTRLDLGDEPIESMLSLLRRDVGAEVHASTSLWSRVEGASVFAGDTRAVLVNVREGRGRTWWRTRATLAHELCHLLFDVAVFRGNRATLIFSPSAERRGADGEYPPRFGVRHDVFRRVEQRANAFAAYFLAPRSGVARLFGWREPPQTPAAVFEVASHFGVSPVTAANHLTNLYAWSPVERGDLLAWVDETLPDWRPALEHPDVVADVPSVDPELRELVQEAVARALLSAGEGALWLGECAEEPRPTTWATDAPPVGRWASSAPAEVEAAIRQHLDAGRVDPALAVLWDAFHDWVDEERFDACRALVASLPPTAVDGNVVVSVVTLLRGHPALVDALRAYERAARVALGAERAAVLLGVERADAT